MLGNLAAAAAAVFVLGPAVALVGVAVLINPATAAASGCAGTAASAALTGTVPATLSARDAHGDPVTLTSTQLERAATIISVGASERIPLRGQLVALIAAYTESKLNVLANTTAVPASGHLPHDGDGADHDSLGLFQMRPSAGWGNTDQLMDPTWSTRAFYGGPNGPNHGSPRGLLDIPHWEKLDPGAAAQTVEVSAFPDRYANNEPIATSVITALTGATPAASTCGATQTLPANLPPGFTGAFITAAAKELGVPYVWGGGNYSGPTGGGFDCSGLVMYAAYVASGGRIRLPHFAPTQMNATRPVAWADKQPGDLIYFIYPGEREPHHVAIYLGGNQILQAPRTGETVRYGTLSEFNGQTMAARRIG